MSLAEIDPVEHEAETELLFERLRKKRIDTCPKCRGTGHIVTDTIWEGLYPRSVFKHCHCKVSVLFDIALYEAGVPRELWKADKIEPRFNVDKFETLHIYASGLGNIVNDRGLSLLLSGENGTGKTSSAAVAVIAAIRKGLSAALISWPDMMAGHLRNRFDSDWQAMASERVWRDLLVIDEVGKESVPASQQTFAQSFFDGLIRRRRGQLKPTIIITNYSVEEFTSAQRYGASIESLLAPPYRVLEYDPGDYRLKMADGWDELLKGATNA